MVVARLASKLMRLIAGRHREHALDRRTGGCAERHRQTLNRFTAADGAHGGSCWAAHPDQRRRGRARRLDRRVEVDRPDVESGARDVDPDRDGRVQTPVIRRILNQRDVECRVDVEQRCPGRRIVVGIGIGHCGHGGRSSGIRVARGVGERRINSGDRTGIRVHPQVLPRVADDTDAVHRRVEIESELGAAERRREGNANAEGGAGRLIDQIQLARGAEAVQPIVRGPHVDADNPFAGREIRDRHVVEQRAWRG